MIRPVRRSLDQGLIATSTAAAAFFVHELRYLLAPEPTALDGHGYLAFAPEALAFAFALSIGLALRGALKQPPARVAPVLRPVVQWTACTVALLAIFGSQELLEGHATGLLSGQGVAAVVPLAALFGAALTAVLRRGRQTIAAFAQALRRRIVARLPRPVRRCSCTAAHTVAPRLPILARRGAGRAPPLTACS